MKYSIRNFFFALLFSLVAFGVAALLVFGSFKGDIEHMLGLDDSAEEVSQNDVVEIKTSLSFLLVCRDDNGAADTLLLSKINKAKKQFIFISIPTSMTIKVDGKSNTLAGISRYENTEYLKKKSEALTGVPIDYTVEFTKDQAAKIIDRYGKIPFELSKSIYEKTDDYTLDLKKGKHELDGETAIRMLSYTDYKDGDKSRTALYRSFMEAFCEAVLTDERREETSNDSIHELYEFIDTDFSVNNFITNINTIFNFKNCKVISESYAGTYTNDDGKLTCDPDIESAIDKFSTFR